MIEYFNDMKMQFACLLILFLIGYTTWTEGSYLDKRNGRKNCNTYFDIMFFVAEISVIFDGITAATVNHYTEIPLYLNIIFHFCFYVSLQLFFYFLFFYFLDKTDVLSPSKRKRILLSLPQIISIVLTLYYIPQIEFIQGKTQNYSSGTSAYITFSMIFLYLLVSIVVLLKRFNYFERRKKILFFLCILICIILFIIETFIREALLSALGITLIMIVGYEWQENPSLKKVEYFNGEMVTSFATLIESKDGSTGGHIKRTSLYVEIIAKELSKNYQLANIFTKDFFISLKKAAPMHDIGKIGIPDYILQKPGRFTSEEFEIMKKHSILGGTIIKEIFGHFDDEDYEQVAFEVATYHHEKWNGKGYPEGLAGNEIPLTARIMAVADVFDAVSAKRCYRDALPLDECFKIIADGKGFDFDPLVVDAFFAQKEEIIKVYNELQNIS